MNTQRKKGQWFYYGLIVGSIIGIIAMSFILIVLE